MSKDKWKEKIPFFLLLALIFFHVLQNGTWIYFNNIPPAWDQAAHTSKSILFSRFISIGDMSSFIAALDTHYGPFVFIITGAILAVTGVSIKVAQFMGTIFFVGTFVAMYLIARDILHNKWIGVLSAYLFSFGLIIYDYSRWLLLDIPITCFVLFGMYFFMKSRALRDRVPAFLMFLFVTMAVYTKIQAISYFVFPFIYSLYLSLKKRDKHIVINLILGLGVASLLFLPWIIYRWSAIINYFSIVSTPESGAYPTNIFMPQYWLFYLKLSIDQIFTLPVVLIIILMGVMGGWKAKYPWKTFILIQTVFIYLSYSELVHKDIRYIFPALAIFTLIAGAWIDLYIRKYFVPGIILFCIILGLSISQCLIPSIGYPPQLTNHLITVPIPLMYDVTVFNTSDWPVVKYNSVMHPQRAILNELEGQSNSGGEKVRVAVLVSVPEFNGNNFYLYSLEKKQSNKFEFGGTGAYVFESLKAAEDYLNSFHYLLYSPDKAYMSYQLDIKALQQIDIVVAQKIDDNSFTVASAYTLPSGKRIFLLKNTNPTP